MFAWIVAASRLAGGAVLVPVLAAALLATVPGFGVLDYHACLALSPVVGLAAAHACLAWLQGDPRPLGRRLTLLLAGPLAVLVLAAIVVPNCNLLHGFGFYLLGPLISALVGAGLAVVAALLAPPRRNGTPRRGLARGLLYLLVLATVVRPLLHFYQHPQVFAYHGLVGYLAGALYEDAVRIAWPYVAFRLLDLALWGPLVAVAVALRQAGVPLRWRPVLDWLRQTPRAVLALGLALTALAVTEVRAGPELWRVETADVARALPVRVEVPWAAVGLPARTAGPVLVLHLPRGPRFAAERPLAVEDAAFRYAALSPWLGTQPAPVHVFLYPDAEAKRTLMGAERVDMAKPWLRQVHMVLPDFGASVLAHELAHVLAADLGPPPFGVPLRRGLLPDAVLIEGLAVAAEWPIRNGLDPHGWSRAMRHLDLAPELGELFSPAGFFGQSSDRAYTLAGSFVRWLADVHGLPAVRKLYATADLRAATGQDLPTLAAAWGRFVDDPVRHPLGDADLDRARARFERPGLFHRPCALEVGRCVTRAYRQWRAGDDRAAEGTWQRLVARLRAVSAQALEPGLTLGWAESLSRIGDATAARQHVDALLALPDAGPTSHGAALNRLERAQALLVRGDLALQAGDVAGARMDWQATAQLPVSEATLRTLEIKQHLVAAAPGVQAVRTLLAAGGPYLEDAGPTVTALRAVLPDDDVAAYLWARWALWRGEAGLAEATLLDLAPRLDGRLPWTAREVTRLVALHRARLGDCPGLQAWLAGRPQAAAPEPAFVRAALARCTWAQAHGPALPRVD